MRWRASCSATNIFREYGDHGSGCSWLILFPVEMGFRLVLGLGKSRRVVLGIGVSRRLVVNIGVSCIVAIFKF